MEFKEKAQRKLYQVIGKAVNRLAQNENDADSSFPRTATPGMPELLREAAAECAVLLRNDDVLPFEESSTLAVFGRVQNDWLPVGYGSGGDVNKPYTVNLIQGLQNAGAVLWEPLRARYADWCKKNPPDHGFWGHWPFYYPEMPLTDELVADAAKHAEAAVVVLGRAAGEDRENTLSPGSYYLTEDEKAMLKMVTSCFPKTAVVLDIGNLIDFSFLSSLPGKCAILIAWQGGMESGNAAADVLLGRVNPSGKLPDTIALHYEDYPSASSFGNRDANCYTEDIYVGYRYFETFAPEKVLYPFGFGLSYTDFSMTADNAAFSDGVLTATVHVTNLGDRAGKEVAALYLCAPQGVLGKPRRVLCGYKKTKLLAPGESEALSLCVRLSDFASFDDAGKTCHKNAWVLEKGEYAFLLGNSVRDAQCFFRYRLEELTVTEECRDYAAPKVAFSRLKAEKTENGDIRASYEPVPLATGKLRQTILDNLPEPLPVTGDTGLRFADIKTGKCTLADFVRQLLPDELEALSRGDYTMNSPLGAKGNAGAMGGVTDSLRRKGVPAIITTDGPSGIRLKSCCSLLPAGTALASSWDEALIERIYAALAREMKEKGSDILLAPGMNIHRNPLCGRNFEYYSEDPFLTGKTAAAAVKGLQSTGLSACPKHFCCNNQETNRNRNDSRVSARALREIYLKGFEICVKEASPKNLMTSYNRVNGVWAHYHYELCTGILRGEWGYRGSVMTDWWMQYTKSPEFSGLRDNAYRVRAQVDVLMPGGKRTGRKKPDGTLLETLGKPDGITLGELQRTAMNVLSMCLSIEKSTLPAAGSKK